MEPRDNTSHRYVSPEAKLLHLMAVEASAPPASIFDAVAELKPPGLMALHLGIPESDVVAAMDALVKAGMVQYVPAYRLSCPPEPYEADSPAPPAAAQGNTSPPPGRTMDGPIWAVPRSKPDQTYPSPAVSWALAAQDTGHISDRLVLVAIAEKADEHGRGAVISAAQIAQSAGVSMATVFRCLGRLKAAGLVSARPQPEGRVKPSVYDLAIPKSGLREHAPDADKSMDGPMWAAPPASPDQRRPSPAVEWAMWAAPDTGHNSDRWVLMAIAEKADEHGRGAVISAAEIAGSARVSVRAVFHCLGRLKAAGLVSARPQPEGPVKTSVYDLAIPESYAKKGGRQ